MLKPISGSFWRISGGTFNITGWFFYITGNGKLMRIRATVFFVSIKREIAMLLIILTSFNIYL